MNKFAIAALAAGLLGGLASAQAATVSIDAGDYVLSYEDTFLTGATVSASGGVVTFSNLSFNTYALGGITEVNSSIGSFDSYGGKPFPIVITAKSGLNITGLTESAGGEYRANAVDAQGGLAGAAGGLVSRWVTASGADLLGQNTPNAVALLQAGESMAGSFLATGSIGFTSSQAIALSALDLIINAGAFGEGSASYVSLTKYQIGVQTAAVPEPEVLALALAGLAVLALRRGLNKA